MKRKDMIFRSALKTSGLNLKWTLAGVFAVFSAYSTHSYGALALQTLAGTGKGHLSAYGEGGEVTRNSFSTNKVSVEAHLDPIKTLPLTLGLFYSTFAAQSDIPAFGVKEIEGFDYGWDVLTWTNVKGFGLSFRYGQALGGEYRISKVDEASQKITEESFQVKNSFVGIGLATPITQTFGVLLEYRQQIESSFALNANQTIAKNDPIGFDGGMLMLGMEISL